MGMTDAAMVKPLVYATRRVQVFPRFATWDNDEFNVERLGEKNKEPRVEWVVAAADLRKKGLPWSHVCLFQHCLWKAGEDLSHLVNRRAIRVETGCDESVVTRHLNEMFDFEIMTFSNPGERDMKLSFPVYENLCDNVAAFVRSRDARNSKK